MGISTATIVETTVTCDVPGCTVLPIHTPADKDLPHLLRNMGWWVGAETPPAVYCPQHTVALHAAGTLPPRVL